MRMRATIDRDKLTSPAPMQPRTGAALSLPSDTAPMKPVPSEPP